MRRLNNRPLLLGLGLLSLFGIGYAYTLEKKSSTGPGMMPEVSERPEGASAAGLLANAPVAGAIEAQGESRERGIALVIPGAPEQSAPAASAGSPGAGGELGLSPEDEKRREMRLRELERRHQARTQALEAALGAQTRVAFEQVPARTAGHGGGPGSAQEMLRSAEDAGLLDPNRQGEKRTFAGEVRASRGSSRGALRRHRARAGPVLHEGSVIPAVLLTGVSSDLPGQLIGQVSEHVYDTVTGKHILVPQGTRVVGTYDSRVSQGQRRVLVAWTRLIYPDGSSVELGSMPGADQAGSSGFRDRVNNHYLRVFGNALLLSAFAAGIQLSQPEPRAGSGDLYTPREQVAGSIGQQMGELGQEFARRNMAVQPTLSVRPGYRFQIMVTEDMELEPWQPASR